MTTPAIFPLPLEKSWLDQLHTEFTQPYMFELLRFLEAEWGATTPIYPPKDQIFSAFNSTPFEQVQVVIMGQDPYHGPGQAHGLSFSVMPGITPPPSLKNIFKEQKDDLNISIPKSGCLIPWAKQGVLMLNATLTVRAQMPRSHYGKGWERFTDSVIRQLTLRSDPVIFVLWGKSAQEKVKQIASESKESKHPILTAAHPSPYSAMQGFFGCGHFSQINALLKQQGKEGINWQL